MKLSIIIPCYNEEPIIQRTNGQLSSLCREWVQSGLLKEYELIYVNDGSRDRTLDLLRAMAAENRSVKVIALSRNFGHQIALTAGLSQSSGDAVVTLDADLQDPPALIEQMIRRYQEGCDIVYGVRKSRDTDSWIKRSTARIFYRLMVRMGVNMVYNHADFRLLSRRAIRELERYTEVNRFLRGMVPTLGFRQSVVEYDRALRSAGQTKYTWNRMFAFALEGITSFSDMPLRMAGVLGSLIFLVSLGITGWALSAALAGRTVPGWASTVLPIYFLGGLQLIFIGVIGTYLGKVYLEVKKRPLFIIDEVINLDTPAASPIK